MSIDLSFDAMTNRILLFWFGFFFSRSPISLTCSTIDLRSDLTWLLSGFLNDSISLHHFVQSSQLSIVSTTKHFTQFLSMAFRFEFCHYNMQYKVSCSFNLTILKCVHSQIYSKSQGGRIVLLPRFISLHYIRFFSFSTKVHLFRVHTSNSILCSFD